MALIVEDGSVVTGADSFLSLADARLLAVNYGITLPVDDLEAEITLRKGYQQLLTKERGLQGERVSADQTGIYPRNNVLKNCFEVASNTIPNEVKMAQLYSADGINSGATTNSVNTGEKLKSFTVSGVYSETYQGGAVSSSNAQIQGVNNQLYPLTKAGLAASNCGTGSGTYRQNMGFLG